MLKKSQRVRRTLEFDRIFRSGKAVHGQLLSVRYAPAEGETKWGFVAGTKQIGNAVRRNRVKRRLREIVRTEHPDVAGTFRIAIIAKAPSAEAPTDELATELFGLLKRATLIR